jgi:hypothetical protein
LSCRALIRSSRVLIHPADVRVHIASSRSYYTLHVQTNATRPQRTQQASRARSHPHSTTSTPINATLFPCLLPHIFCVRCYKVLCTNTKGGGVFRLCILPLAAQERVRELVEQQKGTSGRRGRAAHEKTCAHSWEAKAVVCFISSSLRPRGQVASVQVVASP